MPPFDMSNMANSTNPALWKLMEEEFHDLSNGEESIHIGDYRCDVCGCRRPNDRLDTYRFTKIEKIAGILMDSITYCNDDEDCKQKALEKDMFYKKPTDEKETSGR